MLAICVHVFVRRSYFSILVAPSNASNKSYVYTNNMSVVKTEFLFVFVSGVLRDHNCHPSRIIKLVLFFIFRKFH